MVAYNRLVFSGTLAGGDEQWATGVNFWDPVEDPVSTPVDLGLWAASVASIWDTTLPTELRNGLSATGAITEVRAYFYPAIGSAAGGVGVAPASVDGLLGASRPTSVAACFSLATGIAGRRYRGRMYWPALGNTINTSGRFTGTATAALAQGARDALDMVRDVHPYSTTSVPVVVSKAGGFLTAVSQIRVGDVPDTQRSRRDALNEAYSVVAF